MSKLTIDFPDQESRREFCLWLCNVGEQEYHHHLSLSNHEDTGKVVFNFFPSEQKGDFVGNLRAEEVAIEATRPKEK